MLFYFGSTEGCVRHLGYSFYFILHNFGFSFGFFSLIWWVLKVNKPFLYLLVGVFILSNKGILIYIIALFGILASVFTQQLWLAGVLLFFAGNFKIISNVLSSEGGQKKFSIFCLIGFNLAFLNMLFW